MSILASLAAAALTMAAPAQQPYYQNGAQDRNLPGGSYTRSCTRAHTDQGRLYAECRDTRGTPRRTSIALSACPSSDIGNDNGLLVCRGQRGRFEDRDTDGNGEVTVFTDAQYRGASFTFRGDVPNLGNTGFNDRISSMRMGGDWEVCTDAYFRGQCTVVSQNVVDMTRWNMNDRVSSMRPVRRGGGRW